MRGFSCRLCVLVLLYSKGYFESKNCRHEVSKAIKKGKSITVVHEYDDEVTYVICTMTDLCMRFILVLLIVISYVNAQDSFVSCNFAVCCGVVLVTYYMVALGIVW